MKAFFPSMSRKSETERHAQAAAERLRLAQSAYAREPGPRTMAAATSALRDYNSLIAKRLDKSGVRRQAANIQ